MVMNRLVAQPNYYQVKYIGLDMVEPLDVLFTGP
jgi:hypothetical protein